MPFMAPLSIRTRVTVSLITLIGMAVLEAAIVFVEYRAIVRALDEQSRTAEIRLRVEAMGRSLAAMQAAQRGFVITRDDRERAAFDIRSAEFQAEGGAVRSLFGEPSQLQQLEAVLAQAGGWEAIARSVIAGAAAGEDVGARIRSEAAPAFRALEADLAGFERDLVARSEEATAAFRARLTTATTALIAVPAVAIIMLVAILIIADRHVLAPLAAVAAAARRLRGGDYTTPLPAPRADEVGALIGAFSTMRDAVQERAAAAATANERLNDAHRELLATIDLVPSAIVILDRHGAVRLQNQAATAVLGEAPASDAERKAYWQRFTIRDAAGRPVRIRDIAPVRALAGIETIAEELDLERPDGRRVVILVGAAPLRDEQGRVSGVVAAFQEITRLRELDRLKDEFVAIVSHELRTPLAAIRGSLQLVLDDRSGPADENGELLAVALKSCDRLVRIVNDMLDLSKIEAGKIDLKLAPVAPAVPVGLALDGVQSLADAAGVTLVNAVPGALPEVMADLDRLTQALVNLVSNAVKFAPRGSAITIGAAAEGGMVRFSVTDRGPGISADDIARLFQRFQQLDATATRKAGGTGLGLAITKGIVHEHGGEIRVESEVGAGATFSVTVPLAMGSGAAPDLPPPAKAAGGPPTILVAEDDAEARMVMCRTLERAGFRVVEAADGRQAIEAARRDPPDLVVLDLRMPGVHGHDVIRVLRKHRGTAAVPIVVVSGSVSERQSLESLVLGANIFLTKPADTTALVDDITRLLQRSAPEARS